MNTDRKFLAYFDSEYNCIRVVVLDTRLSFKESKALIEEILLAQDGYERGVESRGLDIGR
jgi:hypothetical protein